MSAEPYLLHVTSGPKVVSDELFFKWYTEEHIPDIIGAKVAARGALYKETSSPLDPAPSNHRKFLAMYQTEHKEPMGTKEFLETRKTSELFPLEGGSKSIPENADFWPRYYELVEIFDPRGVGNTPAPALSTIEIQNSDFAEVDKWYKEEHFPLLAKAPGYRRGLRYKLGPKPPFLPDDVYEQSPKLLTIHEVEDLETLGSEEIKAATETEWTKRIIGNTSAFVARGWKLEFTEGW